MYRTKDFDTKNIWHGAAPGWLVTIIFEYSRFLGASMVITYEIYFGASLFSVILGAVLFIGSRP
jgi:hypothetical protein